MIDRAGDSFFENILRFDSLSSTQSFARELVQFLEDDELSLQPTAVVATEQLEGRGRIGRLWASPAGGLYLTMVWLSPGADGRSAPAVGQLGRDGGGVAGALGD